MHALRLALALVALATLHATASPPRGQDDAAHRPTRRTFGGLRSSSQFVTMRDGVRLAVDVHLPRGLADGERTATILHISRYYRSVNIRGIWRPFLGGLYPITDRDVRDDIVKAGYSWVDVDARGAGASFGHREYPLSPEDVRDGGDLLDWIVEQPWSAGVVGAIGSSYDGMLATMLVGTGHPALKAVVPRFSGWDLYEDVFFPGGLKAASLLTDWAKLTAALDRGRLTDVFGWTGGVVASGVRPVDARLLPPAVAEHADNVDIERLLGDVVYRDDTDPRGPLVTIDNFSPHAVVGRSAAVPIYAYAGWFDGALSRGAIRQYLASGHPGSRLRLGPWFHAGEFNASPHAGGRNNDFDHARELLRFFDAHLRGMDDGVTGEPPVQYYAMGEERWRASSAWPVPGAHARSLYFSPHGRLGVRAEGGPEAHDRYAVDAAATSGAGSRWGLIVGTGSTRGYGDRREADRRLLTYTTEPLEADIEVTGHPTLRVFLSANATDGAVFAYLEEVRPNGEVRHVTEGQLRLLHRAVDRSPIDGDPLSFRTYRRADATPLVPGAVVEVVIDLLPTSFVFRAGHAIRLALAGADAGILDAPLPVTPLVYELHRDQSHPSRLDLPTYARTSGGGKP